MALLTKKESSVKDNILLSSVVQIMILTMGAMLLDGGKVFQIFAYAALAYWIGFSLVFLRRRKALTKLDRVFIRWGYLLLVFASGFITTIIWTMRGY